MLSHDQQRRVDHVIETCTPTGDRHGLVRNLIELKIPDFDVSGFFYDMNCVTLGREDE
jgi:sigma54-dependent transcription regulator